MQLPSSTEDGDPAGHTHSTYGDIGHGSVLKAPAAAAWIRVEVHDAASKLPCQEELKGVLLTIPSLGEVDSESAPKLAKSGQQLPGTT